MLNPKNLVGKPLVVYIDGERRQIGTITSAKIDSGKLFVASALAIEKEDDDQ
jgi:hypothetical protein